MEIMRVLLWLLMAFSNRPDGLEATDRLVPPGWVGNPWGPVATAARKSGKIAAACRHARNEAVGPVGS